MFTLLIIREKINAKLKKMCENQQFILMFPLFPYYAVFDIFPSSLLDS